MACLLRKSLGRSGYLASNGVRATNTKDREDFMNQFDLNFALKLGIILKGKVIKR
jgi:hypothetical protein